MKVRLAGPEDLPAIVDMGRAMHAESRFSRYPLDEARVKKAAEDLVAHPSSACILLAELSSGTPVGMLAAFATDYFFADVRVVQDKVFYVVPRYRGSAAAVKLLLAVRRWATNRSARELHINMSVDIERPRFERFMTRLQFRNSGANFYLQI